MRTFPVPVTSPAKGGDCLLLVDKPFGKSSFYVIRQVRHLLSVKKAGHAGTLDPLATGLLLVGTGKMTKALTHLQGLEKSYTGEILLGCRSASYDLETPLEKTEPHPPTLTEAEIHQAAASFLGPQLQQPPAYSACKIGGKPAYLAARKGETSPLAARPIEISDFRITHIDLPVIHFAVSCSKGTYIRSLAHDLGIRLGTGGVLASLRRTAIGPYTVAEAYTIEQLEALLQGKGAGEPATP